MQPLDYHVTGEGEPVIFVQGVGVHGEGWRPQYKVLSREGYRCLYFDNRGLGRNAALQEDNAGEITVDQMACDALAIMDAAEWSSAHVVGHSLGGLIALRMAQLQRSRVRSLALLCTFANGALAAPSTWRMLWYGMRSRVGTASMRRTGFLGLIMPPPLPSGGRAAELAFDLADLFGHDLAEQAPIVDRQLKAMRAYDAIPQMSALSEVPALVMSGFHDPIAPVALGRQLAEALPRSRFVEVPDASHGLPITHATLVNDHLKRFWQSAAS